MKKLHYSAINKFPMFKGLEEDGDVDNDDH